MLFCFSHFVPEAFVVITFALTTFVLIICVQAIILAAFVLIICVQAIILAAFVLTTFV